MPFKVYGSFKVMMQGSGIPVVVASEGAKPKYEHCCDDSIPQVASLHCFALFVHI